MCGIAGFLQFKNKKIDSRRLIERMVSTLRSRGPDEKGYFLSGSKALGIARLKIIDLVTGSQPIFNEKKDIVVVLNGEIYNYRELRQDLIRKGHHFMTTTDTEVLVHLFEEHGEGMFKFLNGMFAFALLDSRNKKLILARDRIGIKPLYYYRDQDIFAFASELKAFAPLWEKGLVEKKISYRALANYFIMEYVPAPYAIFEKYHKLMPGHYLVLKDKQVKIKEYWQLLPGKGSYDLAGSLDCFNELMEDSVRIRLRSDVPLGIFLSGGIDSSAITHYARKFVPDLSTFSIRFNEPSFDESKYMDLLIRDMKLKHFSRTFTPSSMRRYIPGIINYMDEPFGDASILPTYMLSKFARQKATVCLGGDGGDELLAGYPTYQAFYLARFFNLLPGPLKRIIQSLGNHLSVSLKNFSFDFKVKKFLSAVDESYIRRNFLWLGSFHPDEFNDLFDPQVLKRIKGYNPFEEIHVPASIQSLPLLDQILYLDIKYYLQNDILVKVDRASMATSLEVRVPFLDHRIVEFLFGMPTRYKINIFRSKWILKKMMKERLPRAILSRPKKGFGIPMAQWIKKDMKKEIESLLNKKKIDKMGIVNYKYIRTLLEEHYNGKKDNRKKLWTILSFLYWHNNYGRP